MRRGRVYMRWTLLSLLPFAISCGETTHELLIEIRTDLRPSVDFTDVRTRILRESEVEREVATAAPSERDLSTGFRVLELTDVPEGQARAEVALLDDAGEETTVRTVSFDLSEDLAITISISRSCVGVTCPGPGDASTLTACVGGRCVTPDCAAGVEGGCETPTLPLADLLRQSAEATCEMLERCVGPGEKLVLRAQTCLPQLEAAAEDRFLPVLERAVADGRVSYHPEHAFGCLAALRNECRQSAISKLHLECTNAIEGLVELGGECAVDFECAGVDSYCDASASCPGVCTRRKDEGTPCVEATECASGLLCPESGVCSPPVADGDPCTDPRGCVFGSNCLPLPSGISECVAASDLFVLGDGEQCGESVGLLCAEGLSCVDMGVVDVCAPELPSGSPCGMAIPDRCPRDEYCVSGACAPLPADGEACAFVDSRFQCAEGDVCPVEGGACMVYSRRGDACETSAQCSTLNCSGGVCAESGCGGV